LQGLSGAGFRTVKLLPPVYHQVNGWLLQ
jgi:hypothetical protein